MKLFFFALSLFMIEFALTFRDVGGTGGDPRMTAIVGVVAALILGIFCVRDALGNGVAKWPLVVAILTHAVANLIYGGLFHFANKQKVEFHQSQIFFENQFLTQDAEKLRTMAPGPERDIVFLHALGRRSDGQKRIAQEMASIGELEEFITVCWVPIGTGAALVPVALLVCVFYPAGRRSGPITAVSPSQDGPT